MLHELTQPTSLSRTYKWLRTQFHDSVHLFDRNKGTAFLACNLNNSSFRTLLTADKLGRVKIKVRIDSKPQEFWTVEELQQFVARNKPQLTPKI